MASHEIARRMHFMGLGRPSAGYSAVSGVLLVTCSKLALVIALREGVVGLYTLTGIERSSRIVTCACSG